MKKNDEDRLLSKTETMSSLPPLYPNGFSLVVNMSLQFYYFTHSITFVQLSNLSLTIPTIPLILELLKG